MRAYSITVWFEATSSEEAKEIKEKILVALWQAYPWALRRPLELYGPMTSDGGE